MIDQAKSAADKKADAPVSRWWTFTPLDLLKVMAGIAALAGLTFHLIGSIWNEVFLESWSIDTALFPKTTEWLVTHGFAQVLLGTLKVWPQTLSNLGQLTGLTIGASAAWSAFAWLNRKVDSTEDAPRWLLKTPKAVLDVLWRFLLLAGVAMGVTASTFFVALVLALPVQLASDAAHADAIAKQLRFAKGCDSQEGARCIALKRGADVIGQGFLIDGSPENIAFFDVVTKQVRVVPRAGTEMVMALPKP